MDGQPPRQAEWKTIDMFRHVVPPRLTQGSNQADRSDRLFRALNDGACGVAPLYVHVPTALARGVSRVALARRPQHPATRRARVVDLSSCSWIQL
jgi:hypothetical protein